eukprot:637535-Karenia_brevis.AAC.1
MPMPKQYPAPCCGPMPMLSLCLRLCSIPVNYEPIHLPGPKPMPGQYTSPTSHNDAYAYAY